MGVIVSDNFDPKVPKFLDDRQSFKTLQDMLAFDTNLLPDGFETYCVQTDKKYKYLSTNISRLDTGKWREMTSNSGSSVLQSDLTFTKDVGYVTKGTVYSTGTPIEDILRDMVYKELVGEALTYYGYFDCNATGVAVTNPTVDQIKALNSEAVGTKEFSFYIDMYCGQIVYAIPKSFGGLTKIIVNSTFNYLNSSFTITEMVIDGIDYKVYFLTEPIGLPDKVLIECS